VLGVHHGTLDIHGSPVPLLWTRLASTAVAGATSISLQDAVEWPTGATIAVASTQAFSSAAGGNYEQATIAWVADNGHTVYLSAPLASTHEAVSWQYPGSEGFNRSINIAAEVALLSQSVSIRGDNDPPGYRQGAQIMLHTAAGLPVVGRIENVELARVGQGFNYGRYPVNFDLIGDASSSYVRRVSIHDTYNRGLVLHGVTGLTLDGNVVSIPCSCTQ
jgi:hypothetical protein